MNNYLLVEDDQIFLFLHEHMIKIADPSSTIMTMQSSVKAVEYIENQIQAGQKMPDCILVDLNMPEMNGFQFLEYCRLGSRIGPCLIFAFAKIGDKIRHWHSCKSNIYF